MLLQLEAKADDMENQGTKRIRLETDASPLRFGMLTSLCKIIQSLVLEEHKKVLSLHKTMLTLESIIKNLERPEAIPKSVQHKFELTASERVRNDPDALVRFEELKKRTNELLAQCCQQKKAMILEMKKLEVEVCENELVKQFCASLGNIAHLFWTRYAKKEEGQEVLSRELGDELVFYTLDNKPEYLEIFGFGQTTIPADGTQGSQETVEDNRQDFFDLYQDVNHRLVKHFSGSQQEAVDRTGAKTYVRLEKLREKYEAKYITQFERTVQTAFYDPIRKSILDREEELAQSATRKQASLIRKETATAETAMDVELQEPTQGAFRDVIDSLLKKQEQKFKKMMQQQLKQPQQQQQQQQQPTTKRNKKKTKGGPKNSEGAATQSNSGGPNNTNQGKGNRKGTGKKNKNDDRDPQEGNNKGSKKGKKGKQPQQQQNGNNNNGDGKKKKKKRQTDK